MTLFKIKLELQNKHKGAKPSLQFQLLYYNVVETGLAYNVMNTSRLFVEIDQI